MIPVIDSHRVELETVCRRYGVKRLELFGSAARGEDHPDNSDLDFLVEFPELPAGSYADTYFGLRDSLESLFGRPVDLVVAETIRNPHFREGVERSKTLLYAA